MKDSILGITFSIMLVVFLGAALIAGTWGWSHPWIIGCGAALVVFVFGLFATIATPSNR